MTSFYHALGHYVQLRFIWILQRLMPRKNIYIYIHIKMEGKILLDLKFEGQIWLTNKLLHFYFIKYKKFAPKKGKKKKEKQARIEINNLVIYGPSHTDDNVVSRSHCHCLLLCITLDKNNKLESKLISNASSLISSMPKDRSRSNYYV